MFPEIFNYEGQGLAIFNIDGEPWFIAKEVCAVLEISNHRDSVTRLRENMKRTVGSTDAIGRPIQVTLISEAGAYKLVFTSRKPEAIRFIDWLAEEVIPSIRKTGTYSTQLTPTEALLKSVQLLADQERQMREIKEAQSQISSTVIDHTFAISSLEQRVTNEITLTTREQAQIQGAVSARVAALGNSRNLYQKLYSSLKRQFGVPSYRDLKRSELTRAFAFIKAWKAG